MKDVAARVLRINDIYSLHVKLHVNEGIDLAGLAMLYYLSRGHFSNCE